jgi:hypothetical protein
LGGLGAGIFPTSYLQLSRYGKGKCLLPDQIRKFWLELVYNMTTV